MGIIVRAIYPLVIKLFSNQRGCVCLADVDGTTYLADERFIEQCTYAELEREGTIPLEEEEVLIEDVDDATGDEQPQEEL